MIKTSLRMQIITEVVVVSILAPPGIFGGSTAKQPGAAGVLESFNAEAIPPATVAGFEKPSYQPGLTSHIQQQAARTTSSEGMPLASGDVLAKRDSSERFLDTLAAFLRQNYHVELIPHQRRLLDQFLLVDQVSEFSEEIQTRLHHGEAAIKFSVSVCFLDQIFTNANPDIPSRINQLLNHPKPTFETFFAATWPASEPGPRRHSRFFLQLVMSCVDETDPSGETGQRLATDFAGQIAGDIEKLPVNTWHLGRHAVALHHHALTVLSHVFGSSLANTRNIETWLESSSLVFRVHRHRAGRYFYVEPSQNRAFIGDAAQELLVCREAVRQARWKDYQKMSTFMRTFLAGKAQAAIFHAVLNEKNFFPFPIQGDGSRATFLEDMTLQVFVESGRSLSICEKTYARLLSEAERLRLFDEDSSSFIRNWARHLDLKVQAELEEVKPGALMAFLHLEKRALKIFHRQSEDTKVLDVTKKIAQAIDFSAMDWLPEHQRAMVRQRLVQALAILGMYEADIVTPWLFKNIHLSERSWISQYADFLAAFGYTERVGPLLLEAARQEEHWYRMAWWRGFLDSIILETAKALLRWGVHAADKAGDMREYHKHFLLGVMGEDAELGNTLSQALQSLNHHYQAGHAHASPEWIQTLQQAIDNIFDRKMQSIVGAGIRRDA